MRFLVTQISMSNFYSLPKFCAPMSDINSIEMFTYCIGNRLNEMKTLEVKMRQILPVLAIMMAFPVASLAKTDGRGGKEGSGNQSGTKMSDMNTYKPKPKAAAPVVKVEEPVAEELPTQPVTTYNNYVADSTATAVPTVVEQTVFVPQAIPTSVEEKSEKKASESRNPTNARSETATH
jgi:hypothetical protein